jgi:hypothetical protein
MAMAYLVVAVLAALQPQLARCGLGFVRFLLGLNGNRGRL